MSKPTTRSLAKRLEKKLEIPSDKPFSASKPARDPEESELLTSGSLLTKLDIKEDAVELKDEEYKKVLETIKLAEDFRDKYGEYFDAFPRLQAIYDNIMKRAFHASSKSSSYEKYVEFVKKHGLLSSIKKEYELRLNKILSLDIVKNGERRPV